MCAVNTKKKNLKKSDFYLRESLGKEFLTLMFIATVYKFMNLSI